MDESIEQQLAQLNQQLANLYQLGKYEEAIHSASRVRDLSAQNVGEEHPDFATSLNNLAMLYQRMGNYAQAEPLHTEAMECRRKALGEEHPDFAQSLNNLAVLYHLMGNYAQAEPFYKEAMEIWRKALGEDHPDFAQSLNNLAVLYHLMGNYAQAEPLHKEAMEISRKALGENHPDFAQSLNDLALLYQSMGNYSQAEPLHTEAMEIRRKALGEDHPDFANSLNDLAALYYLMGNYAQAELLYKEAMEIWSKALGEDHPNVATSLHNLAALYQSMGNYAQAEPLYKEAMESRRKALGEDHPNFAQSLNDLAALYQSIGNYAQAEPLYKEAIESRRKALGEDHPDFATSLNSLAVLYQSMGNYAQAEPLYKEAMESRRKALGEDHPIFATSLHDLAVLYQSMGNYAQAEPLYKVAMEIWRKALGEDHPNFSASLYSLAVLYQSMGNYAQAEPLNKEAMEIWRKALGEDHPNFAQSLNYLAWLYAATDRETEAFPLMEQASYIDDRMIGQVFSIGSESQRTAYLKKVHANFDYFLSLVYQYFPSSSTAIHSAFELVLRRKAIGAEALAVQRDAVLGGRYPELEEEFNDFTSLRMEIAQKSLAGPGPEGLAEHQKTLAIWNKQKENLEAELAGQIPEMNLEQKLKEVDRQAIASALPEKTTLIEFVRFDLFDFKAVPAKGESTWKQARYLAFVIPAKEPDNVQMIDLGEAGSIDRRIARFRDSITGEPGNAHPDRSPNRPLQADDSMVGTSVNSKGIFSRILEPFKKPEPEPEKSKRDLGIMPSKAVRVQDNEEGVKLRKAIFDKLLPALGTCKHLIISPDGELSRIPFEVLPNENGRFLIDDYRISYLGAGRDILRFGKQTTRQPAKSLVIADPDFDLGLDNSDHLLQKDGLHSRRSRDLDRAGLHFGHLPGTEVEGKSISKMLAVQPWLKGDALEAQLKKYPSPRILHFATHGFFLEDQERDPNSDMRDLGVLGFAQSGETGRLTGPVQENPLLRSGLALAGVNTWLKDQSPPPDAEDGLLTAEDVTGLDLLDTELVVLSACETGLGEIRTGEGVFGLRRSFVLAGADTLVMSLWKVPDQQTQELMENFYRRILNGEPRSEALKNGQMTIRSKHPHPFYWGAFICQGNPGPLRSGKRNIEISRNQTIPRSDAIPEKQPSFRPKENINRNAPCPCGSGKRYKHCCGQL